MLIDAPSYDYDKDEDEDVKKDSKKGKTFNYSELSQESFLAQLDQYK